MTSNRSARVFMRAGVMLAIMAAGRCSFATGSGAYLPAIGPTPLRFPSVAIPQATAAPNEVTAAPPAPVAVPTPTPMAAPEPPTIPAKPSVTMPDVLRSLVLSPLWAALCEGLIANPNPLSNEGFATTQNATTASTPVVTAEMLVDFFRTSAASASGGTTNSAVAPPAGVALPVFVLPSSSATYRTQ